MLDQFPKEIKAGVSLIATIEAPLHLAPAWSVTAMLRGPSKIDLVATGDGSAHEVKATALTTATWEPGRYAVTIRASNGEDVFELEAGQAEVVADLADLDAGHDPRGHAERTLEAIEAVIEKRATKDQSAYTINGRQLQRTPIADLLAFRTYYRNEVARLKSKRPRRLLGRQVKARFA